MKLRDLMNAFGAAPAPREIETFVLASEGEVRFAQWRHPSETRKIV